MDISVPSRFSCLKIEDDEFRPVTYKSKKKQPKEPLKKTTSTSTKKTASNSSNKKKQKAKNEANQWEEWKRKDEELINDQFQQDLHDAILRAKLDYEVMKNEQAIKEKPSNGVLKKKAKTMSLDEFLEPKQASQAKTGKDKEKCDFFDKVAEAAKTEMSKEILNSQRKERELNFDKVISLAQCQDALEKQVLKNQELQKEIDLLKVEVATVKKRNTTLCSMLSQGEMKEKAEVLLELDQLTKMKDELTEEVARLHKLLEQERSKSNGMVENHVKVKQEKNRKKK